MYQKLAQLDRNWSYLECGHSFRENRIFWFIPSRNFSLKIKSMWVTYESSRRILFPEGSTTTVGSEVFESPIWHTWTICNLGSIKANTWISQWKFFRSHSWLLNWFRAVRYGHMNHYTPTAIYLFKAITVTSEKPPYDYLRRCCVGFEQINTCWESATYFFIALIKQTLIVHWILYSFCEICNITKCKSIRKTCIEFYLSLRRSI